MVGINYQGTPCKNCDSIIQAYSTSGYCRDCWHERHGSRSRGAKEHSSLTIDQYREFCDNCGRPIPKKGLCFVCQKNPRDYNYLNKYRTIYIDGTPVSEHRYIFQLLVSPIPKGYVIHHLNGLKGDNRKNNLCSLPKGDHDSKMITNILKARIRELEGLNGKG